MRLPSVKEKSLDSFANLYQAFRVLCEEFTLIFLKIYRKSVNLNKKNSGGMNSVTLTGPEGNHNFPLGGG